MSPAQTIGRVETILSACWRRHGQQSARPLCCRSPTRTLSSRHPNGFVRAAFGTSIGRATIGLVRRVHPYAMLISTCSMVQNGRSCASATSLIEQRLSTALNSFCSARWRLRYMGGVAPATSSETTAPVLLTMATGHPQSARQHPRQWYALRALALGLMVSSNRGSLCKAFLSGSVVCRVQGRLRSRH
jgi:hypothetical protein